MIELAKGISLNKNKNITVLRLHYSADPDKDPSTEKGKKWFDQATQIYPMGAHDLGWRREMEIDPFAGSGELIFPDFMEKEPKVLCDPYDPDIMASLYGGFDWGTRNPVSFHVYEFGFDGVITSIWEYYDERRPLVEVAKAIRNCPYYDRLEWIASDPSMWTENQATNSGFKSIARMFIEDLPPELKLTKLIPAHNRSDMRFIQKIVALWEKEPYKFRISKICPNQIQEFRNLKYPQRLETKNDVEKILDKANHSFDDAKYAIMTHPSMKTVEIKPKWGTIGHLNDAYDAACEISLQIGRDVQEIYDEIQAEYAE